MNSIKIITAEKYLPDCKRENDYYNKKFNIDDKWIEKRTGIKERYIAENETVEDMATKVAEKLINKNNIDKNFIDMIIVASTTTDRLMPGISFIVQKNLNIDNCICLDILAGCGGFTNAFDIARKYIVTNDVNTALVIGVEKISSYVDENDISTSILFGDAAGAILIEKDENVDKLYKIKQESIGQEGDILTCNNDDKKIFMDGNKVYKFAVTKMTQAIDSILKECNIDINQIKYIVPHQSNIKILESVGKRLNISLNKIYTNLENVGNTFCASIPIAYTELLEKNKLQNGDKIILFGYGGGLNMSCILLEI